MNVAEMDNENKKAEIGRSTAPNETRELTNIDVSIILREITGRLIANQARLDQFYQLDDSHFVFRFKTKEGKKDLVFNPPRFVFLRDSEKAEGQMNPFVSVLKNSFLNRILKSASQIRDDRIISLEFEGGSVILELMRKGNAIVVKDGKIAALDENEKIKERPLELNGEYSPPPSQKKEAKKQNVIESLKGGEKLVVAITRNVAVPALYVNELLEELGFDPKSDPSAMKQQEAELIGERIEEFASNVKEGKAQIVIFKSKYLAADKKLAERIACKEECKTFGSLSEVLSSLYASEAFGQIKKTREKKIVKLMSRLEHQEARAKQAEAEIDEEKRKGEWIISNMEKVNQLVQEYKNIKASNDKSALEGFLKKNKAAIIKNGIQLDV